MYIKDFENRIITCRYCGWFFSPVVRATPIFLKPIINIAGVFFRKKTHAPTPCNIIPHEVLLDSWQDSVRYGEIW